jgi:glycosyltransferase involved in cell wall biosynthesis
VPSVLIVTTVPQTLRRFMLPFVAYFRARGFRVDGMARDITHCTQCTTAFDHVWDIGWSRNALDRRNLLAARRRVREVVCRQAYDLVHVHTPVAGFVTRAALRRVRRTGRPRVIYTAHGFHFYRGGPKLRGAVFRALETLAGRWTDHLVVINREDEQAARRLVPPERVHYMPGIGVDLDQYDPKSVAVEDVLRVREEMGLGVADSLVLMVAEFNPGKRHRDAVAALARQGRPDVHLALAGTGPLMDDTRRRARDLGLAHRVHFLGFRFDIPALARASVAVVLPSEREGMPRSIMEALSLGVPAIGTQIRGTADLLEGGCGVLVPVGDVPALARALSMVLDDPAAAEHMVQRGRERIIEFDVRKVSALHDALYRQALATP